MSVLGSFDAAKPGGQGKYEGRFGQRRLDFAANVLKEFPSDKLVVACMHIPLQNYLDPADPELNTADQGDFFGTALEAARILLAYQEVLHTFPASIIILVPTAASSEPSLHHHVLTTVSGSWWSGPYDHRGIAVADSRDGSPNGFHILSIDGQNYSTRFQPAEATDAQQMLNRPRQRISS